MAKRVRYVLEEGAPFAFHGEGLTIQAVTRKNEVPVTVEIEGLSRKRLRQLRAAIRRELVRREESWKRQRDLLRPEEPQQAAQPVSDPDRPAA
jgi:hypothetical protein